MPRDVAVAQPPPELVIWPESSMPGPILVDEENHRFVMDLAAAIKTDLLLGSIDEDEKGAYNAAMLVSDGGAKVQLYRKLHLVPFGEYVPGRHALPFVAQIVGDQVPDDFAVGKEAVVFRLTSCGKRTIKKNSTTQPQSLANSSPCRV